MTEQFPVKIGTYERPRSLERWCPEPESNRHDRLNDRGILSPLRLPVPPPGLLDMLDEAGVGIEPASTALQAAA